METSLFRFERRPQGTLDECIAGIGSGQESSCFHPWRTVAETNLGEMKWQEVITSDPLIGKSGPSIGVSHAGANRSLCPTKLWKEADVVAGGRSPLLVRHTRPIRKSGQKSVMKTATGGKGTRPMLDLFGDHITAPTTKPAKGVENAAAGFAEFWQSWPSGPRKVAKQQALNKWATLGCADSAAHILAHVEWMKKQPDWIKDGGSFICAPLVYLNQQRWVDWEAPKPVPRQPDALAKIKAHKGAPIPAHVQAQIDAIKKQARGAQA